MANLTGAPAGDEGMPGGSDLSSTKEVFDPIAKQVNLQRIERIFAVMGIAAGCVTGIVGLTSLEGFGACSVACHVQFFVTDSYLF